MTFNWKLILYFAKYISQVEKLRGRTFVINHGVADDNVHYQQSMLLIRALELAGIRFQQQSYPEENHSLSSVSEVRFPIKII